LLERTVQGAYGAPFFIGNGDRIVATERIASLLAGSTEILYGLGLGDRVVCVSHECDFPAAATEKPRVTRTNVTENAASQAIDEEVKQRTSDGAALYDIDVDLLASLKPDLIVTQAQCDVCAVSYRDVVAAVRTVDALKGTKVVALNPTSLAEVFADIERVGAATGRIEKAAAYISALRGRVEAVQNDAAELVEADRPRTVCIEWIEPVMVAANWMPELVAMAGGRNGLTTPGQPSGYTDWGAVVDYDPDVIVVMPCGFDLERTIREAEALPGLPGWGDLRAVRDGRVYAADGNAYFNRSGPRIVDSLEMLGAMLHPEIFGDRFGHLRGAWRTWQAGE
jgi:iron complex transport system substrate-binding protein